MALPDLFRNLGFEKVRRGLALLALSFWVTLYLLVALTGPDEARPMFGALFACYFVAFMGLSAEWFWARWFASGLGWSGFMVGVFGIIQAGWHPVFAFYGGLHGLVVAALMGDKMAALYDMQEGWRTRYGMDEYGVARWRKTVTRAAASLPTIIIIVLGPREGQGFALGALGGLLAIAGLGGVLRMRSWGLLALAGASAAIAFTDAVPALGVAGSPAEPFTFWSVTPLAPSIAALLLAFAVLPFARPALRFLLR